MLTRDEFARQTEWPRERVHGWAPGSYSCTCGDCGIHYVGGKRSVQCYPCAAKFVPPSRPETAEEKCDRLAAELLAVREELGILREIADISRPRVRNTNMKALCAAILRHDVLRAALSQPTKTGGG